MSEEQEIQEQLASKTQYRIIISGTLRQVTKAIIAFKDTSSFAKVEAMSGAKVTVE